MGFLHLLSFQLAESSVLVGRQQLVGGPHYHLPPSQSHVTWTGGLHRLHHPLYAASTSAVRIVVRDSHLSISRIERCFFFYSVMDVISNVAKYNTSVKIYLSKSKITDLKNYLKITKYTKKLLNYSNVSK